MKPSSLFVHGTEVPNTLLIIDDAEVNRAVLDSIFSPTYAVEQASNGQEGLELILRRRECICAVLLDVVMPVMDGIELLRRLAENSLLSQIPVFLITAEASSEVTRLAYDLGVVDVISKPVIPYVVERRVNSVVELYQARKRLGGVVEHQQSRLLEQAQQIVDLSIGMIEALSTAIEFRSGESGSHVRRIRDITALLLRKTELGDGLSSEQIDQIALAAVMHDVGKIAIPDAILNKPGRLTPEEFEIMKTHTVQGGILLAKIPQMRSQPIYEYAYDIALHHHERWDGRGYPEGLKGDEISVWAQIVSIADVYDALVSARVYKGAFSFEEAVQMIASGQCGVFSPRLLRCFLSVEGQLRALYESPASSHSTEPS